MRHPLRRALLTIDRRGLAALAFALCLGSLFARSAAAHPARASAGVSVLQISEDREHELEPALSLALGYVLPAPT